MRKGFTLVELSLTIFIIALIGAAALTGLNHYRQKAELRFQQGIIEEHLLLAKQEALTRQRDIDLLFLEKGFTVQSSRGVLREVTLAKPFTVSSLRLGFNADGNPRFAGTLYLYRRGQAAAKMTVAVGSGLITWSPQ
ncbi:MAG: prepilin-type N-terminal cleavage/methylation domain-containing protein [Candidatus Margulisbacteria bacterium]|jgi:prepilin-type N-terminal cleavage/methylation domain-containing protein|nr:prepilin-type N-terminal cleavage/methylation domain-containing protein [Candidatus Margulisiibacteriota bacterium]